MAVTNAIVAMYDVRTHRAVTAEDGRRLRAGEYWADMPRFLCGVIRWVHVRLENGRGQVAVRTLATNRYWSPLAMIDDLMRPWAHFAVAWDGITVAPMLAALAVPPAAISQQVLTPNPFEVARVIRLLEKAEANGAVGLLIPTGGTTRARRWWNALGDALSSVMRPTSSFFDLSTARKHGGWVSRSRSWACVVPVGSLAVVGKNVRVRLVERTWDPAAWLVDHCGAEVTTLDDLAKLYWSPFRMPEASDVPVNAAEAAARLWERGDQWSAFEASEHLVSVLGEVLHLGLSVGSLGLDQLRSTDPELAASLRSTVPNALHQFRVDTYRWRDEVIARATRRGAL